MRGPSREEPPQCCLAVNSSIYFLLRLMPAAAETYTIRPSFKEKFRPAAVKALISAVLSERLQDKTCVGPDPSTRTTPAQCPLATHLLCVQVQS